jgi:hypothetical protein
MTNFIVHKGPASIRYLSTRPLREHIERIVCQPDFWGWSVGDPSGEAEHTIRYDDHRDVSVAYTDQGVDIAAPWSHVQSGETLLYAALPFVELQSQRLGFSTLHGACVALPQGAVLLLGTSGAGKTVTALQLCLKHGARLIGNDLVEVGRFAGCGQLVARGGSKFVFLRRESIRRSLPELLPHFGEQPHAGDSWQTKVKVDPADLGIEVEHEVVPITGTYMVHVDESQEQLFVARADNVVTRLYLNESLARYIRGLSTALLGPQLQFLGYIPSYDSPDLFARRVDLVERIVTNPPIKYVSGNVSAVARYLA